MVDQKLIERAQELILKGEAVARTGASIPDNDRPGRGKVTDRSFVNYADWTEWRNQALSFLRRTLGESDTYAVEFSERCQNRMVGPTDAGIGILRAVHQDLSGGYLARLPERVRADLFSDFMDIAEHLQTDGFQDAAIVLGGGVLESQLRLLCAKTGIPTGSGNKSMKAEIMNNELYGADVYDLNQQKQVTAWLGIRNDPAHGHYKKYTPQQVALFLASIRDFISRHPA